HVEATLLLEAFEHGIEPGRRHKDPAIVPKLRGCETVCIETLAQDGQNTLMGHGSLEGLNTNRSMPAGERETQAVSVFGSRLQNLRVPPPRRRPDQDSTPRAAALRAWYGGGIPCP